MEIDLTRDGRDGDAERSAAPQSDRAVRVEVVAQEGNGAGGMVATAEGSDCAALETVGVGAEDVWICHQCREKNRAHGSLQRVQEEWQVPSQILQELHM